MLSTLAKLLLTCSVFARLSEDSEKLFLAFVNFFTLSYVNTEKLLTLWILNMYIFILTVKLDLVLSRNEMSLPEVSQPLEQPD